MIDSNQSIVSNNAKIINSNVIIGIKIIIDKIIDIRFI
jgi:hypothetical protein